MSPLRSSQLSEAILGFTIDDPYPIPCVFSEIRRSDNLNIRMNVVRIHEDLLYIVIDSVYTSCTVLSPTFQKRTPLPFHTNPSPHPSACRSELKYMMWVYCATCSIVI